MNREIKFRGKNLINGQWVYGGLAEDKEGNFVILPKGKWHRGACVDKDTIGQFTGLHDMYGRAIYEGDIVYLYYTDKEYDVASVCFNKEVGAWCLTFKGNRYVGSRPLGEILREYPEVSTIRN